MKRLSLITLLATLVVALGLSACGGGTKTVTVTTPAKTSAIAPSSTTPKSQAQVACPPPPGAGFMGACAPRPVQIFPGGQAVPLTSTVSGGRFPDVSSWQGHVNWSAIVQWQKSHGWRTGGVFKIGEYGVDPYASTNNSALRALGAFRAGYWFVRNTGCSSEGGQIRAEAKALGLAVVVLDMEVPEARGYAACLVPGLKAAGFTVAIYTAPGTWPGGGGSTPYAWMAAYGSVLPGSPFGGAVKAWQCTDGVWGCVTSVPGLGRVDVSIDYGFLSLGQAPPKPKSVFTIFPTLKLHTPHGSWTERGLAESIDGALQHKAKFAAYLRDVLEPTARWFADRISFLAFHVWPKPRPNWHVNTAGSRRIYLAGAAAGRRIGP